MRELKKKKIGEFEGIKVYEIDRKALGKGQPTWDETKQRGVFLGCNHYDDNCEFIPEDEIWISNFIKSRSERDLVIKHQLVEREVMKQLQEKGLDKIESRKIAHPIAKQYESEPEIQLKSLRNIFEK
jgi:hypothetical protein